MAISKSVKTVSPIKTNVESGTAFPTLELLDKLAKLRAQVVAKATDQTRHQLYEWLSKHVQPLESRLKGFNEKMPEKTQALADAVNNLKSPV